MRSYLWTARKAPPVLGCCVLTSGLLSADPQVWPVHLDSGYFPARGNAPRQGLHAPSQACMLGHARLANDAANL